jgi:hypothetical protein
MAATATQNVGAIAAMIRLGLQLGRGGELDAGRIDHTDF